MAKESEIIFYQGDDGNIRIEVFYHDDTFWMTQKKNREIREGTKSSHEMGAKS